MAPMDPIWLLRGCFWVPLGLHMAAPRLQIAAHGAAYDRSEAAFGCRGVAFCCTGAVYGSHAADMQHMLHLAGPGWAARILRTCQVEASWAVWGPYLTAWGWRFKAEIYHNAGSRPKDAHEL